MAAKERQSTHANDMLFAERMKHCMHHNIYGSKNGSGRRRVLIKFGSVVGRTKPVLLKTEGIFLLPRVLRLLVITQQHRFDVLLIGLHSL